MRDFGSEVEPGGTLFFFSLTEFAPKTSKIPKMVNDQYFRHFPSVFATRSTQLALKLLWWEVGFVLPTL